MEEVKLKKQSNMLTDDLISISLNKLEDACRLLENDRYEGACYNGGYSVECMIKYIFLTELQVKYYNKQHFKRFISNYNKLQKAISNKEILINNQCIVISQEIKIFLENINNNDSKIIYNIDIDSINEEIRLLKIEILNDLNEINKVEEIVNRSNRKKIEEFELNSFSNSYNLKEDEDLKEYKELIRKISTTVLNEHAFRKAINMLNEEKRSGINLNDYKTLLCWWEQWRYRCLNEDCIRNSISSIDNKEFSTDFIRQIINIMNKIVVMNLVPIKQRKKIEKKVSEAERCIQNFAQ